MRRQRPVERRVVNLAGDALNESDLDEFKSSIHGTVLRPGDAGYESGRTIFNAMIDRRPGLIVKCSGAADAVTSVNFARDNQLLLAVKGGATMSREMRCATAAP